jgi:hypothetical protein
MEKYLVDCTEPVFGFFIGQQTLLVHDREMCIGEYCCIHNPSPHKMRTFPQLWRADRGLMERTCSHGIGHPDPDHLEYVLRKFGRNDSIHGCKCGCCRTDGRADVPALPQVSE